MALNAQLDALVFLSAEFPSDEKIKELKEKLTDLKTELDSHFETIIFLERMQERKRIIKQ